MSCRGEAVEGTLLFVPIPWLGTLAGTVARTVIVQGGRVAAYVAPKILKSLPKAERGVKTHGVFVSRSGSRRLVSGRAGPASEIPKGTPGFTGLTRDHVEGHAAALMRQERIKKATLYINRPPCTYKPGCDANLERMLPPGAKLTVFYPGGKKVYRGRAGDSR